jgi:hypothetical protein
MPKKTISLNLSAEQADSLQASFAGATNVLSDEQFETIARLAVGSWIDLFGGRKRYRSLTEQYLEWLDELYSTVLKDEEPGERRIFGQLHFPFGQAQYLSRILRDQHLGAWRRKAFESLKSLFEGRLDEAKKWAKDGRGEERMVFTVSKGARVEMDGILGTLSEANTPRVSPIRTEGSMGTHVSVSIVASNIPLLLNEVNKSLKG